MIVLVHGLDQFDWLACVIGQMVIGFVGMPQVIVFTCLISL